MNEIIYEKPKLSIWQAIREIFSKEVIIYPEGIKKEEVKDGSMGGRFEGNTELHQRNSKEKKQSP
ncbi:MAG: hypothetical protein A2W74_00455 [Planctomycetes bacterium RIFCSPLOWO2_12_38_17]|nr:MAG: hypothetical protein A3C31_01315 [Candidatus Roizmanbacteria bacterium RIFCSPHIGHO2_02_FULL_40_53]OHB97973.1 MAG: hypothetical protein A2W74_00455 [Planctomycetes bacterium RIFCSPLOWO2_12_38_17]